ncbi:Sec-independent protein translocase TatB [Arthrobacter sp. TES]|uniref:twin-arginine translocation protein subunit TatB n=1 Tax=Paenarthrobacter ureafaciens TaxID=37931 RepID=UPI000397CFC1|nr:twin-arginine translocation protein subunit TatB [Paenarthrobacter ureafaciens]AOY70470.1 twin-arginine translocation protein subunit TatB [Arthrobacter sp. ZXY-2]ERI38193.1 preprotein translocase subunit TatA [Arthrobacter sp. AK-YN10]QOI62685.1 Sec-independent protein translocase TatB [Arthrobacter sp. TES]BCW85007.1 translocase [Arthrobacter sp. NicSoilE8]MBN9128616.1 Sec-independent protein translocase TatB [Paenarthrobacter ureafaciens]
MFGINGPEFIVLLIIGVLIIGPSRLPEYTQKLANLVKEVRRMASGAREQIKEEVGIDIDDVDWKKYDPRQYDPRRIIKDALFEDDTKPVSAEAPAAGAAAAAATVASAAPARAQAPSRVIERLAPGEPAPFDTEAT